MWVDTAFNGALVIPREKVVELRLVKGSTAEAILADGQLVEMETFACFFDWFGNSYERQIAASEGEYPLLGTMLLDGRRLELTTNQKLFNSASKADQPDLVEMSH